VKRSLNTAAMRLTIGVLSASAGCGYKLVKKSDLKPRRLPEDSIRIAALESQLTTQVAAIRAQCTADSLRYAALLKQAQQTPPAALANADSLLRAREQEIQTLREQLTKLTAELERIKRRLANPRS